MSFLAQPPVLAQNDSALLVLATGARHSVRITRVGTEYLALLDEKNTGHQKTDLLDAVRGTLLVLYVTYGLDFNDICLLADTLVSQYNTAHC